MAARKKLTKKQLGALRTVLEDERAEMLEQAEKFEAGVDLAQWRDAGSDDDYGDSATAAFERDRAQSLANHARRTLVQIEDALRRMEHETYGVCERCGEPIPYERLEVIPFATLCMDCKQLAEHGR